MKIHFHWPCIRRVRGGGNKRLRLTGDHSTFWATGSPVVPAVCWECRGQDSSLEKLRSQGAEHKHRNK